MMKSKYYDAIAKKYNLSKNKKNIILIGTPNHGNLGDQAIAYAELEFLKKLFQDRHIVEISMQDFAVDIEALYYFIRSDDIIALHGGGNCGNFYMDDEMLRRYVVLRFIHNKIILFPQSVYFTDDDNGRKERNISSRIYGRNRNLYLIARDAVSEEQFKSFFQNTVYRLPDAVLTLPCWKRQDGRNGVLLCLRNDEEKILDKAQQEQIENLLKERYKSVKKMDTVVEYQKEHFQREHELEQILDEIGSAMLVVTDRLHGVLFSIITGTPCIALPTFNTKIISAFEEVKTFANVILVQNTDEFVDSLEKIHLENQTYQNERILQEYQKVFHEIISNKNYCLERDNQLEISEILDIAGYWSAQHYETEYWRAAIEDGYKKLEQNNHERINELSTYKTWVASLESQLEQMKSECEKILSEKDKEMATYKEWTKNLEDRLEQAKSDYDRNLEAKDKEIVNYKEWTTNLENEKKQIQNEYQNILSNKNDEIADYLKQIKNLDNHIVELKKEYLNALNQLSEKDKKLSNYEITITDLQKQTEQLSEEIKNSVNELQERERQWNIQQRELYNCIKTEREKV